MEAWQYKPCSAVRLAANLSFSSSSCYCDAGKSGTALAALFPEAVDVEEVGFHQAPFSSHDPLRQDVNQALSFWNTVFNRVITHKDEHLEASFEFSDTNEFLQSLMLV